MYVEKNIWQLMCEYFFLYCNLLLMFQKEINTLQFTLLAQNYFSLYMFLIVDDKDKAREKTMLGYYFVGIRRVRDLRSIAIFEYFSFRRQIKCFTRPRN